MSDASFFFVDTNVLLYSFDPADPVKRERAGLWMKVLWQTGAGRLSWQVLHEFYVNSVRKLGSSNRKARSAVEIFCQWEPVDTSLGLIQRAWHWTDAARINYWDGLIVAAAEHAGCRYILTEDLQEGRSLGPMTIVNPFHTAPGDFGLASRT